MKSLYYRSHRVSDRALGSIALATLVAIGLIHVWPSRVDPVTKDIMLEAAYRTEMAYDTILCRRLDLNHKMLKMHDPARTGMLGPSMSLVTTLPGHLDAKQTSVNPNFAAVAVKLLKDAGVQEGDRIAIGMTGSFPALNVALLQAAEAMQLRPSVISSAASSQFGANHPDMMWPDMERILHEEGLLSQRSLVTSRGGFRDAAAGMTDDTRDLIDQAIERNGCVRLESDSLLDSISSRMKILEEDAEGERFAAYVNVGGGAASVAGTDGNANWGSGVILPSDYQTPDPSDPAIDTIDCVAARFLQQNVPLVNLIHSVTLAKQYDLAIAPQGRPLVGQSNVYQYKTYRRSLAALGLAIILLSTWIAVFPPRWCVMGLQRRGWWKETDHQPRWMV